MERQKIVERDSFTLEEKYDIYNKSNGRCVHCGKRVEFGGQASVEHFVPLSKGGTNRDINMVMTCHACNKAKGNMILAPHTWCKYLNEKHKDKLKDYFDSYIRSFEYMGQNNILACDEYDIYFYPEAAEKLLNVRKHKKKIEDKLALNYKLSRVQTEEDLSQVQEYFIDYLKKYDLLCAPDVARQNIMFWYKFGALYFIKKDGEIKLLAPVTLSDLSGHETYGLSLFVFSKYSNNLGRNLIRCVANSIPEFLLSEQDVGECKVECLIPRGDPAALMLRTIGFMRDNSDASLFHSAGYVVGTYAGKTDEEIKEIKERANKFFEHFIPDRQTVENYCHRKGNEDIDWMQSYIFPQEKCIIATVDEENGKDNIRNIIERSKDACRAM